MKRAGLFFVSVALIFAVASESLAQDAPAIPGKIAYIGTDYNVYSADPAEAQPDNETALTNDAGIGDDTARFYQWPTWSTDGRLAYFGSLIQRTGGLATEVFISIDGLSPGASAYVGENEDLTYAYWSPQNCGEDCRDLAVLLSGEGGFLVELVRSEGGEATSSVVGTGAPFYYSWSPDGARMLWQRNNQQLEIYDTGESRVVDTLEQSPGAMFAPAWSPVDDRLLFGALNESRTDLVIAADGEITTLVEQQTSPLWFSWSPDGSQIAYIDREGPLLVLDAASGEVVARSPVDGVLSFFWSPDSAHIAYVTLGSAPGSFSASAPSAAHLAVQAQEPTGLAWSVLDVADGANRRYGSFMPTQQLVYLLTYFDQFSQSHRLWSPDSRHLVYSEVTPDERAVISLLDTTQQVAVPLVIADGVIGIWSFN